MKRTHSSHLPPLPRIVTANTLKLNVGETYKLTFVNDCAHENKRVVKNEQLLGVFKPFALFIDEHGVRECFDYFTVEKLLQGASLSCNQ